MAPFPKENYLDIFHILGLYDLVHFFQTWFFGPKNVYFLKNDFFSAKKMFICSKMIFSAKKYFYPKLIFSAKDFSPKNIFCAMIFSAKDFSPKNIFCAMIFSAKLAIILTDAYCCFQVQLG